jgi:hypothetical protein
MSLRRERLRAAMMRAALSALVALCVEACEFARTNEPYQPSRGASVADWDGNRAACVQEASTPVELYQLAVWRTETTPGCESLGQMMRAAPETW